MTVKGVLKLALGILFFYSVMAWRESIPMHSFVVQSSARIDDLRDTAGNDLSAASVRSIYPRLGIFRIDTRTPENEALDRISGWESTQHCSPNKLLTLRRSPDDPLWEEQWDMMRIGLEEAWETTTGGLTINGDTIVVAVLDAGFDLAHPDLIENIWKNRSEIPNDQVDNDGNGYVDDYIGLYLKDGNDNHPTDIHGAAVSGIIAAEGNNARGVTGVNWKARILPISGIFTEADVIEGYNYMRDQRERYNASGGVDGAFIVVSNLSAGIDGAFAVDHPLWCAVYDDLGELGILSTAAVTNRSSDIDIEGDMPGTCESEFLITVTNTGIDDEQFNPSGYGRVHVDLGAPGTPTFTLATSNDYANFGSTSAAAPHVAGVAALMYAVPCTGLGIALVEDPVSTALTIKNLILNNVEPRQSLEGRSASEGRLNAAAALDALCPLFDGSDVSLEITNVYPNPLRDGTRIDIQTGQPGVFDLEIYDMSGRLVLLEQLNIVGTRVSEYIELPSLATGAYILRLRNNREIASRQIIVH